MNAKTWAYEFDAYGGYDCMSSGYKIRTAGLPYTSIFVIDCANFESPKQAEALARLIVRSVNSHAELLAACKWALDEMEGEGHVWNADDLKPLTEALVNAEKPQD